MVRANWLVMDPDFADADWIVAPMAASTWLGKTMCFGLEIVDRGNLYQV